MGYPIHKYRSPWEVLCYAIRTYETLKIILGTNHKLWKYLKEGVMSDYAQFSSSNIFWKVLWSKRLNWYEHVNPVIG